MFVVCWFGYLLFLLICLLFSVVVHLFADLLVMVAWFIEQSAGQERFGGRARPPKLAEFTVCAGTCFYVLRSRSYDS